MCLIVAPSVVVSFLLPSLVYYHTLSIPIFFSFVIHSILLLTHLPTYVSLLSILFENISPVLYPRHLPYVANSPLRLRPPNVPQSFSRHVLPTIHFYTSCSAFWDLHRVSLIVSLTQPSPPLQRAGYISMHDMTTSRWPAGRVTDLESFACHTRRSCRYEQDIQRSGHRRIFALEMGKFLSTEMNMDIRERYEKEKG